jgi:hypothetical protein
MRKYLVMFSIFSFQYAGVVSAKPLISKMIGQIDHGPVLKISRESTVIVAPQEDDGRVCASLKLERAKGSSFYLKNFCRDAVVVYNSIYLSIVEHNTVEDSVSIYRISKGATPVKIIDGVRLNKFVANWMGKLVEVQRIDFSISESEGAQLGTLKMTVAPSGKEFPFRVEDFQILLEKTPRICWSRRHNDCRRLIKLP